MHRTCRPIRIVYQFFFLLLAERFAWFPLCVIAGDRFHGRPAIGARVRKLIRTEQTSHRNIPHKRNFTKTKKKKTKWKQKKNQGWKNNTARCTNNKKEHKEHNTLKKKKNLCGPSVFATRPGPLVDVARAPPNLSAAVRLPKSLSQIIYRLMQMQFNTFNALKSISSSEQFTEEASWCAILTYC